MKGFIEVIEENLHYSGKDCRKIISIKEIKFVEEISFNNVCRIILANNNWINCCNTYDEIKEKIRESVEGEKCEKSKITDDIFKNSLSMAEEDIVG